VCLTWSSREVPRPPHWSRLVQGGALQLESLAMLQYCENPRKVRCPTWSSDLLASHKRKCDCAWSAWQHGGFLVTERWWNHYAWVQGIILYRVSNYHDSHALDQEQFEILPRLDCIGLSLDWSIGQVWDESLCSWSRLYGNQWDESMWFLVKVVRQSLGSCGLRGIPRSRPL
jgi:hypothetical protein